MEDTVARGIVRDYIPGLNNKCQRDSVLEELNALVVTTSEDPSKRIKVFKQVTYSGTHYSFQFTKQALPYFDPMYALYQMFGDDLFTCISVLVLLGCGFGAGMILGFMATIYVSGERVYAPLYGILLMVTLYGISRQKNTVTGKLKEPGGKLLATLIALSCVVNVLFITLSV